MALNKRTEPIDNPLKVSFRENIQKKTVPLALAAIVFGVKGDIHHTITSSTTTVESPLTPAKFELKKDIIYTEYLGQSQKLDIVSPTDNQSNPLVIFVHGGGWKSGDKSMFSPNALQLAKLGYVTATINYRLTKEGNVFPAPESDVRCAVRYLKAHAEEYRIDKNKIAIIGMSAGANLAVLTATAGNEITELDDGSCQITGDSSVNAAVGAYGIYDLLDPKQQLENIVALLGQSPENVPKLAQLASPKYHLDSQDPPLLIIVGNKDEVVDPTQSENFFQDAISANIRTKLLKINAGHAFPLFATNKSAELTKVNDAIIKFLSTELYPVAKN